MNEKFYDGLTKSTNECEIVLQKLNLLNEDELLEVIKTAQARKCELYNKRKKVAIEEFKKAWKELERLYVQVANQDGDEIYLKDIDFYY